MEFWGDDRAQSVQIGAVLLFGFLVIALTTYQTTVVPQQNAEVEYNHNQAVGMDMLDLRNDVLASGRTGRPVSTTVQLGTRYPARAIFINPPPPSGTIETRGTNDPAINVTIGNATATGEAEQYWNAAEDGDGDRTFETGAVIYSPDYNEYRSAPQTGIDIGTGVVFNAQDGTEIPVTDQQLVRGARIDLVLLTGNLSEGGAYSTAIDARPQSSSDNTITLEGEPGRNVTITLATRLDPEKWRDMLSTEPVRVDSLGSINGEFDRVRLTLERDSYRLSISKVGVGTVSEAAGTDPAYVVTLDDDRVVNENTTQTIRFELRDELNNPIGGGEVTISVPNDAPGNLTYDGTSAKSVNVTPQNDGSIAVEFAADGINESTVESTVTASFNGTNAAVNITVVNVGGGGGSGSGGGGESDPGPPGNTAYNDENNNGEYDSNEQTYQKSEIESGFDDTSVNLVIPSDLGTLDLNGNTIRANSITLQAGINSGSNSVTLRAQRDINIAGQSLSGTQATIRAGEGGTGILNATGATVTTQNNNIDLESNGNMNLEGSTLDAGSGSISATLSKGSATLFVDQAIFRDADDTLRYDPNGAKVNGTPSEGSAEK